MEFLVVWLICAVVTAIIASAKDRSGFGWFLIGLLLGIFGVILIACLPSNKPQQVTFTAAQPVSNPGQATKACPDCGETVLAVAKVCKHCGFRFAPAAG